MTKRGRRARWMYRRRRRIGLAKPKETLRDCWRMTANFPNDRIYDHDSTAYPKYRMTGTKGAKRLADHEARPRFVIDYKDFKALLEYSWSTPTGVVIGKMWRAYQPNEARTRMQWWIYRYEVEPDQVTYPNMVRNARYVPVIRNVHHPKNHNHYNRKRR